MEDIGGPPPEEEASEHKVVNLDKFPAASKLVEEEKDPKSAVNEPMPQGPKNLGVETKENVAGQPSEL